MTKHGTTHHQPPSLKSAISEVDRVSLKMGKKDETWNALRAIADATSSETNGGGTADPKAPSRLRVAAAAHYDVILHLLPGGAGVGTEAGAFRGW